MARRHPGGRRFHGPRAPDSGAVPPSWPLFLLVSGYPLGWNRVILTGPLYVGFVTEV